MVPPDQRNLGEIFSRFNPSDSPIIGHMNRRVCVRSVLLMLCRHCNTLTAQRGVLYGGALPGEVYHSREDRVYDEVVLVARASISDGIPVDRVLLVVEGECHVDVLS